jgi:4-diphosphocytidyl-2-C-methyl-D-erythritol kinase
MGRDSGGDRSGRPRGGVKGSVGGRKPPQPALRLEARAKINLGLEVLAKRPDGYHEIRSLMQSIRLADRLDFFPDSTGRVSLRCPGSGLPSGRGNLVTRAAQLLKERTGVPDGARIVLHKRIPIGAGLGGGSSAAPATLVGLTRLWKLQLAPGDLESIGAELGADVPFFVRGGTQLAEGKGDRLTRLPALPPLPVLIVSPALFISTASIYRDRRLALTLGGPLSKLSYCELATRSGVVSCVATLRNDLESIVVRRHPRVGRIMREIGALAPVVVRVSGSGSSLFVLGEGRSTLRRCSGGAPVRDCRVVLTRFAGRGWISIDPRVAGSSNGAGSWCL